MIQSAISGWLGLSGTGIFLVLIAFYAATGLIINWICFRPAWRNCALTFNGIVPPFFVAPGIIFALMISFLANDVWQRDRLSAQALRDERVGLEVLDELSDLAGPMTQKLRDAVRDYINSVLRDEWPQMQRQREAPETARFLDVLMRIVADQSIGQSAGIPLQNTLINAATRVANARSVRLSFSTDQTDKYKWSVVLVLGILGQLGVAVVHLERRRAQALSLIIFSASSVAALGLIAICEQPFNGSRQISPAPLELLLIN